MAAKPRAVPGLDEMTAEESALMRTMQQDDAASPMPARTEPAPAPAVTETSAPEAGAEPEPAHVPTMVDKRALDEERTRRRTVEKRETEARIKYETDIARANTRLEMLMAAVESKPVPAAEPEAAPPAFDQDPKGWIEHSFKALERRLGGAEQKVQTADTATQQWARQQQEHQSLQDLERWGQSQEAEFAGQKPDYQDAMRHLMNVRAAELAVVGVVDPVSVQETIRQDVRGLAQMARTKGGNFGEMLYKLSEAKGYRAAPAAGTAAPDVAATAAERLVRGGDMATNLSGTGSAPRGEPAAQALVNMTDQEWESFYAKVKGQGKNAMRNLFGA